MTQISFRSMVEGEINNSNKMEAGRFILELVKIEKIAKNQIDFLFECLQRKKCNYHGALFCLYVYNSGLIGNCEQHKKEILKIAKAEINLFKKEIENAKIKLLLEREMMNLDPIVEKIQENKNAFFMLTTNQQNEYKKKFNNLTELMVAHKSKLLNFTIACHGGTVIQDYEDGLITRQQYISLTKEYAKHVPEICKKYKIEGPAEIVINRTNSQEI